MDNKNLLLLFGAAGIFWYIRNQQADKQINATGQVISNGGGSYTVPTQAVATNPAANPFGNINNLITSGTELFQTGAGAFNTIKDALNIKPNDMPPATADGVWAGPSNQYEIS